VQGNSPILAGIKLAPLAVGMLISSPPAGIWADRRGSRMLAVLGMLVTALGLALMTTLGRETAYLPSGIYMFIVGIGSGMFNSPNTAAMMGAVPVHRRGIAGGHADDLIDHHGPGHDGALAHRARHERLAERVSPVHGGDGEIALAAAIGVLALADAPLQPLEIRQHIRIAPAAIAELRPGVGNPGAGRDYRTR